METDINEEITIPEICEDNTQELLDQYDNRSKRKISDVLAMQATVCIITIAIIICINIFYPETGGEILNKLHKMTFSKNELFPNPISFITELI